MHKGIHSQRFIERRRRRRQILTFLSVLCLVTIAASSILLLRAPFMQIKNIVVEDAVYSPKGEVARMALASLSDSYLNIIPHSNSLFFSKKRIKSAIKENFEQIENVEAKRSGFSGLVIKVRERVPAAIVCAGFRDVEIQGECYFADRKGFVFGSVSSTSPAWSSLNHFYLATAEEVKVGENFMTAKLFAELQKFTDGVARGGILPLGILIGENGEYEMYVKNYDDSEVTIYFDSRSPFKKTEENLLTFWQSQVEARKATTTPAFNYINLRFGNTVYYSKQ